jgi:hypothetical protein
VIVMIGRRLLAATAARHAIAPKPAGPQVA